MRIRGSIITGVVFGLAALAAPAASGSAPSLGASVTTPPVGVADAATLVRGGGFGGGPGMAGGGFRGGGGGGFGGGPGMGGGGFRGGGGGFGGGPAFRGGGTGGGPRFSGPGIAGPRYGGPGPAARNPGFAGPRYGGPPRLGSKGAIGGGPRWADPGPRYSRNYGRRGGYWRGGRWYWYGAPLVGLGVYGYGSSCYNNCLAAGYGPAYCSTYSSDFCY
jgi:hypothetical protein